MKYFRLVLANLGRHKLRSILTIASVALALFLFASLRSVTTTMAAAAQFGGARRLVTLNATGLVFPLPLAYGNRIRALPGVTGLSWANWFGGRYGDGKNFFANFAWLSAASGEIPSTATPRFRSAAHSSRKPQASFVQPGVSSAG